MNNRREHSRVASLLPLWVLSVLRGWSTVFSAFSASSRVHSRVASLRPLCVLCVLCGFAGSAWAQEGLSGSSSSVYQDQRQGERTSSDIQESFTLNYNTQLTPEWRTAWYSNILWQKNSELEYPNIRPFVGAGLFFGQAVQLNATYSFIEDRNYRNGEATLDTSNWAGSLGIQPKDMPSLWLNYALTASQDDLSPHSIDVDRMTRSIRLSDRFFDGFELFYMHTDAVDANHTAAIPPSILFGSPVYVAADASGAVYVVDQTTSKVLKFNASGGFIMSWGAPGSGPGQFMSPSGVATDPSGNVYVVDSETARVQKFDGNGNFIVQWGTPGAGDGQFNNPTGLAADATGIYVADRDNNRIQKFDFNGNYLTKWGSAGAGVGQFLQPEGVASDGTNVFVADTANHRIQSFDTSGAPVTSWGAFGSANGFFSSPRGVAVDGSGFVYVSDSGNNRIQRFAAAGGYVSQWGTGGSGDGQFSNPIGVAVDSAFDVFVVDSGNDRIQRFQTNGTFVTAWGNSTAPVVGDSRRRFRQDSVGGSFSRSFRNVLTIGTTFGLDRGINDDGGAIGETIGTNYWISPMVGIRLLRDVNLSYNFTIQEQETALSAATTKRVMQNHNVALSFVPFTGTQSVFSYHRSTLTETPGIETVTQGPNASASFQPVKYVSLNVGAGETRTEVEGQLPTITWLYTASSNVTVYGDNALTATWSRAQSEARETEARGLSDSLVLDMYLAPWKVLRVTERNSVALSSSESPGSSSESKTWATQTAVSWMVGEGAAMSNALGYSAVVPSAGPRTNQWSDQTTFSYTWRSHSFYVFHSVTDDQSATRQLLGTSLRIAVAQASAVGLFAQRNVGGGTEDGLLRVDFTVSF